MLHVRFALVAAIVAALLAPAAPAAPPPVPAPRDVLGFTPGDDRKLAAWADVVRYFERLAAASDRVELETIGRTTLGRPMVLATISSPANLARLARLREIHRRLADPRTIRSDEEARALAAEGRAIVLVTCGIHSNEVGSTLASMQIAHRLATDSSPEVRRILREAIVLVVPSLNPDGVDIVKQWYDHTLGKPWEGVDPPALYHHYVGHDNNRDWYAFTQIETRNVVERVHNRWRPLLVNDVHEQGSYGSRMFLPPYVDPIEPNVPPEIVAGVNAVGTAAAWALTAQGKTGVVTNAIYDAWTPARAYIHYHGGLRILSETASANTASPMTIPPTRLQPGRGYDSRKASANFPAPWPGGEWRLANVVDYMTSAAMAIVREAAVHREQMLWAFYRVGRRAVTREAGDPFAFLVPPEPELLPADPSASTAAREARARARAFLLGTLDRADVEVHVASRAFHAGGQEWPAGTALIPYDQPYGAFAKALLERQDYPDRRQYEGGPPVAPYDVTAHTLSLLSGFEATRVDEPFALPPATRFRAPANVPRPVSFAASPTARVGIYKSNTASMDEGWTRWFFDQFGVPYASLGDHDVRAGNLRARFDAIVLSDMRPSEIERGHAEGTFPQALVGGLGAEGARALERFVEEGGTLVALNRSSQYAISALELPVRNALEGAKTTEVYGPGSILAIEAAEGPVFAGMARRTIAWFEGGPAFEAGDDERVRVLARFAPADRLLISGWLLGGERIAGKAAAVEVSKGKGRAVLFAFRPQYRGQSLATLPALFNAVAPR